MSMNPPTNTVSLPAHVWSPTNGFNQPLNWGVWCQLALTEIQGYNCSMSPLTVYPLNHKQNHNHFYLPNVSIDKQKSGSIFSTQNASITVQQSTLVIWGDFRLYCFVLLSNFHTANIHHPQTWLCGNVLHCCLDLLPRTFPTAPPPPPHTCLFLTLPLRD